MHSFNMKSDSKIKITLKRTQFRRNDVTKSPPKVFRGAKSREGEHRSRLPECFLSLNQDRKKGDSRLDEDQNSQNDVFGITFSNIQV